MAVSKLLDLLAREKRLFDQAREIRALRGEIAKLQRQNESMRTAMRRCLTCDYRLEVMGRR